MLCCTRLHKAKAVDVGKKESGDPLQTAQTESSGALPDLMKRSKPASNPLHGWLWLEFDCLSDITSLLDDDFVIQFVPSARIVTVRSG